LDIQVNFVDRKERKAKSRYSEEDKAEVQRIGGRYNANVKVVENRQPPVLSTLVAEIYGPDYGGRSRSPVKWKDI
jgi:hypothetical protein